MAYPAHIRPLTSLRFFAAAIIVVYHLVLISPFQNHVSRNFAHTGHLAVDFFFMLSGFILMHVYGDVKARGGKEVLHFYRKRFARVYPLHFVMLITMALLAFAGFQYGPLGVWREDRFINSFFIHLGLMNIWVPDYIKTLNIPAWSISAEAAAYLAFPLLAAFFIRLGQRLAIIFAVVLTAYLYWHANEFFGMPLSQSVWRIFPEFSLGIALCLFFQRKQMNWRHGGIILYGLIAGVLILMASNAPEFLIMACFAGILVLGAARAKEPDGGGWLAHPVATYLGEISYAMYMVHYVMITAFMGLCEANLGDDTIKALYPLIASAIFIATLALAALLHKTIELPARDWIAGGKKIPAGHSTT